MKSLIYILLLTMFYFMPEANGDENSNRAAIEKEREELMEQHRALYEKQRQLAEPLLKYDIELLQAALKVKVFELYNGSSVVSHNSLTDEYTFLGLIADEYNPDSIFNPFGVYGSEYSQDSIWNEYGKFGGEFSQSSPFNEFSPSPPLIVKGKRAIGVLTVNNFGVEAVDPEWLRSYFTY